VFYAWGAPRFLPVVLALGSFDYTVSRRIAALTAPRPRKLLLRRRVAVHLSS